MDDGTARRRFLAVSNIIPDPALPADQLAVPCALCGAAMTVDLRGGLCTGPTECAIVCDRCGDAQAPVEMKLVRQLRNAVAFTVTVDGADPRVDPFASTCPVCDKVLPEKPTGWHIVDTVHGRPVCRACVQEAVDASQTELAKQLNLLEMKYEVGSMAPDEADRSARASADRAVGVIQARPHAPDPDDAHTSEGELSTACHSCHAHDLHRSRFRPWERVLKLLTSRRPYRCGTCGWRGWMANSSGN